MNILEAYLDGTGGGRVEVRDDEARVYGTVNVTSEGIIFDLYNTDTHAPVATWASTFEEMLDGDAS